MNEITFENFRVMDAYLDNALTIEREGIEIAISSKFPREVTSDAKFKFTIGRVKDNEKILTPPFIWKLISFNRSEKYHSKCYSFTSIEENPKNSEVGSISITAPESWTGLDDLPIGEKVYFHHQSYKENTYQCIPSYWSIPDEENK